MTQENAIKFKTFLDEFRMATGTDGKSPFTTADLPSSFDGNSVVRLRREQVVRFRNTYRLLIEWAAIMCDVEPQKLAPINLIAPFLKDEDALDEELL